MKNWPTWECEPSTFEWSYKEKETCLIVQGEAKIKTSSNTQTIKSGDLVTFPKGFNCIWEISKTIKKHYRLGE